MRPRVQDGYSDAVTQGRTPPPSSHGSCKPIDEYPNALRGPCRCGDRAGVPTANGRDHQSCYLLLAHPLNGGHVVSSGCGKYKYKCVCVCVICVCGVRVYVCMCVHVRVCLVDLGLNIALIICFSACSCVVYVWCDLLHVAMHCHLTYPPNTSFNNSFNARHTYVRKTFDCKGLCQLQIVCKTFAVETSHLLTSRLLLRVSSSTSFNLHLRMSCTLPCDLPFPL